MYLQATLMRVWSPCGQTPIVMVHPGRDKRGFYGTLDLRTGREIVMQSAVFNAATTARYLEQLLTAYPEVPILLLWDRASWHRGPEIDAVLARNPRLEIMLYPVASPDLNPQEHVWKLTRQAVGHNHTFPRMPELADHFEAHLKSNLFDISFLDKYDYFTICSMFN